MSWETEASNWIAWARAPGHDALPFDDRSLDLVIAYNSLMDFDDMPGAVPEAGHVLEAGGRFCTCVTHPFLDSGEWGSPDMRFVVEGSYLGKRRFEGTFLQLRALKPE